MRQGKTGWGTILWPVSVRQKQFDKKKDGKTGLRGPEGTWGVTTLENCQLRGGERPVQGARKWKSWCRTTRKGMELDT